MVLIEKKTAFVLVIFLFYVTQWNNTRDNFVWKIMYDKKPSLIQYATEVKHIYLQRDIEPGAT